ncbi:MAG: AraC family transcriptional regulator [Gemmatimonadota bacterium]
MDYAAGESHAAHSHPVDTLTLVCGGSLVERAGSAEARAGALSVVVKPAGTEHSDRFGSAGARTFQVVLDGVVSRSIEEGDTGRLGWKWIHGGPAARAMLEFAQVLKDANGRAEEAGLALFGVLGAVTEGGLGRDDQPPRWLRRVRERIDDDPARPIRVWRLAQTAGVHPVSLTRAFRRHHGVSVTSWIHRRRVERAAGLLSGGSVPIARVALQSGFADQSHLTRIFRRATGLTPAAYRRFATAS